MGNKKGKSALIIYLLVIFDYSIFGRIEPTLKTEAVMFAVLLYIAFLFKPTYFELLEQERKIKLSKAQQEQLL